MRFIGFLEATMSKTSRSNLLSFLQEKTDKYQDKTALGMKSKYGWVEFTYDGLASLSKKIASYLINDLNIKRNEKIAILSESRVEFGAVYFASIIAGTTFVPLDIKLTIFELTSILSSCLPEIIFASKNYVATAQELKQRIPSIKKIILVDEDLSTDSEFKNIYSLPNNTTDKFRHRSLNSTALIIYTSGTTGKPKGVEITFNNILSQMDDLTVVLDGVFKNTRELKVMSILPMNHLFELTFGFSLFLNLGSTIYYTNSLRPKDVLSVMRDKKINFMCTVPSFFRMLKMQFQSDLVKQSKMKQLIFKINFHVIAKIIPFNWFKKLLFKDIHNQFGNEFHGFVAGGAPMDLEMAKYFYRVGINAFQGYGLSEASPIVCVSLSKKYNMSSVGPLLKSFEAKIDKETSELLVKGPAVMKGYYKEPELTSEVITQDGWLHTGDIAKIGSKGEIYITGRIKNMIVLPGGKKIFPEEVEAVMESSELIKEVCVFCIKRQQGEKKDTEEVGIVVTPKDDLVQNYDKDTIIEMLIDEVKKKSMQLSQYKRPTNINVYFGELPKTATRKIKRKEIGGLVGVK